jgi:hypothetical protein
MRAYLPIIYNEVFQHDDGSISEAEDGIGGPPVDDGGVIYVYRDDYFDEYFDNYDAENPEKTPIIAVKTSFAELVDDLIDAHSFINVGSIEGKTVVDAKAALIFRKVQASLRDAADKIDNLIFKDCMQALTPTGGGR